MTADVDSGAEDRVDSAGSAEDPRRQVVLIVEDNDADRDVYGGLLWYNGYDVIHSPDGESAIESALEARPDLVLLDIRPAGAMSGLDVARTLRQRGCDVPMIVLSALSREEVGDAAAEASGSVFLQKPVDPFAVVKEVMHHIGPAMYDRKHRHE